MKIMKTVMHVFLIISMLFAGLSQSMAGMVMPQHSHMQSMKQMNHNGDSVKQNGCHHMEMAKHSSTASHDCCDTMAGLDKARVSTCNGLSDQCNCDLNCHLNVQVAPISQYQHL